MKNFGDIKMYGATMKKIVLNFDVMILQYGKKKLLS
jgi:hypothetical protein